jgi:Uma2 family endonuclease
MIHKARAGAGLVDYETYRALVKDGEKADLIDGVIYMASPDKKINNDLNGFIYQLIDGFMAARNIDGVTFLSRFSCRITEFCAPEPDVGYVRPDRAHLVEQRHMLGGPDIAVEIVSRDSRARDYGVKRELYQSAGVAEYWIIDPLKGQALFLRLEDGKYQAAELESGHVFRSSVIPGFWLDVHWLFSSPLPKAYHCLAQILKVRPRSARKKKSR